MSGGIKWGDFVADVSSLPLFISEDSGGIKRRIDRLKEETSKLCLRDDNLSWY